MSKISNMSMIDIFDKIDVEFDLGDIYKICSNKDVANKIYELIAAGKDSYEVMVDNEDYIDKEKLLLIIWLFEKKEIKKNQEMISAPRVIKNSFDKSLLEQEIRDLKNNMQRIKKLCKDVDTYLTVVCNNGDISEKITVVSSKEEILGFDFSEKEKHNRKIFDYIDKNLIEKNEEDGMKYAIQSVEIRDLMKVLPLDIAKAAEYKITNNTMAYGKEYIEKFKQKELKGEENDEETDRLSDEYKRNIALPEMRDTIEQVLKYIDLEKLLLIEIYNLEEELDFVYSTDKVFQNEKLQAAKTVTTFLLNIIGKDTILKMKMVFIHIKTRKIL